MIIERMLKQFPRESFSLLPTPIHKLENISRNFSINLYCKRDDLTGFAFGGNKTRKLDYLIAGAREQNADTLIAVGATQSNFCRIAAAAGKVSGLEVHLVLGGTKPEKPNGNLLLDHLFGATIHYIDSDDWNLWEGRAQQLMEHLTAQGKRVSLLPVGGSTPIGALGYINAFTEILEECKGRNITINTIVHASSSGGTQAGLIAGKGLTGWNGSIIGMGVAKNKDILTGDVLRLAQATGKLVKVEIASTDVIVENSYMGPLYGSRTAACERAIKIFSEQEGIILDHVYTGKAAAGIIDYAERGLFPAKENVLFIHTGGNVEIFE